MRKSGCLVLLLLLVLTSISVMSITIQELNSETSANAVIMGAQDKNGRLFIQVMYPNDGYDTVNLANSDSVGGSELYVPNENGNLDRLSNQAIGDMTMDVGHLNRQTGVYGPRPIGDMIAEGKEIGFKVTSSEIGNFNNLIVTATGLQPGPYDPPAQSVQPESDDSSVLVVSLKDQAESHCEASNGGIACTCEQNGEDFVCGPKEGTGDDSDPTSGEGDPSFLFSSPEEKPAMLKACEDALGKGSCTCDNKECKRSLNGISGCDGAAVCRCVGTTCQKADSTDFNPNNVGPKFPAKTMQEGMQACKNAGYKQCDCIGKSTADGQDGFICGPSGYKDVGPSVLDIGAAFGRNRYAGVDYSKGLETFIEKNKLSPFWATFLRGDSYGAFVDWTCSIGADKFYEGYAGVMDGIMSGGLGFLFPSDVNNIARADAGSNTAITPGNGFVNAQAEIYEIPEEAAVGGFSLLYKITFMAVPDCKTDFTVTLKNDDNEFSVFVFNGRPVFFQANQSTPVSYAPSGSQGTPVWQLLPSRKRFDQICLNILPTSAGCFSDIPHTGDTVSVCSPIPLAAFAGGSAAAQIAVSETVQPAAPTPDQMAVNPAIQ